MTYIYCEIIDLSAHWGKLSAVHCHCWQHDYNNYSSSDNHVSAIWLKDLWQIFWIQS
jgi:hypothetical protein